MADDEQEKARERLYERYDNDALDNGIRLKGDRFLGYVERIDEIDSDYAEDWLNSIYGFTYRRSDILDDRTRELAMIGQHVVLGHHHALPDHMNSALRFGATPREILEIILVSRVTGGVAKAHLALMIWRDHMKNLGLEPFGHRPLYDGPQRDE